MSDESFTELMESLNQALQYERGERDDLRVTVLAVPAARSESRVVKSNLLLKQKLAYEVADMSETAIKEVTDFAAFLKSREQAGTKKAEKLTASRAARARQ